MKALAESIGRAVRRAKTRPDFVDLIREMLEKSRAASIVRTPFCPLSAPRPNSIGGVIDAILPL